MFVSREMTGKKQRLAERRRTERLPFSFQIQVSGVDHAGEFFREYTVTTNVSGNGCRFDLLRQVRPKDVLAIQVSPRNPDGELEENRPLLFEVIWSEPNERGWAVGAAQLQPGNIWHITFPPMRDSRARR
jgi:PilZ domain-containing protein